MMLLGLLGSTADASPIRQHRVTARGAQGMRTWNNFLAGGVALWSQGRTPLITTAVRRAMITAVQSADPLSSPWVQYLLWRQGLNPRRFNYYHPWLAPQLPQVPVDPPVTPPVTPPVNPPEPEIVNPPKPEVPEPSTGLMAVVLVGAGLWWRRRTSRLPIAATT